MTRLEIEEQIKEFMTDELELNPDKIVPKARLIEDIGIDSLDFIDIVVIVEKKFGFKINPEEMGDIKLYSQFCDYIEKKLKEK